MLKLRMADIKDRSELKITDHDRQRCLSPGGWLNDEIINKQSALALIASKKSDMFIVSSLVTAGIATGRANDEWAPKSGIDFCHGSVKMLLMPVNVENTHWVLFVVNMKRNILVILDPQNKLSGYKKKTTQIATAVTAYIDTQRAALNCLREPMTIGQFNDIPAQTNGYDCGMYVLMYINEILAGAALHPVKIQKEIDKQRKAMLKEI